MTLDARRPSLWRPIRRRHVAVILIVALGMLAAWLGRDGSESGASDSSPTSLPGVWDPEARARVQAAFLRTGAPYALDSWLGVRNALDDQLATYLALTHAQPPINPATATARTSCLVARRDELAALVRVLAEIDVTRLESAVTAALDLAPISVCLESTLVAEVLSAEVRTTDLVRPMARRRLAEASARHSLADDEGARADIATVLVLARSVGDDALAAEAHLMAGQVAKARATFARVIADVGPARWVTLADAQLGAGEAMLALGDARGAVLALSVATAIRSLLGFDPVAQHRCAAILDRARLAAARAPDNR